MFRSKQYCERYEMTPFQLDKPLVSTLANNAKQQQKKRYHFQLMI